MWWLKLIGACRLFSASQFAGTALSATKVG